MRWGRWVLRDNLTLYHEGEDYEIDLEEVHTSADVLDWVFQILGKRWADAATMHDLLRAMDDVLDPQANYFPFGEHKRADGGKLARAYLRRKGAGRE